MYTLTTTNNNSNNNKDPLVRYNKTDYIMSSGTSHVTIFTQGMPTIAHEARLSSTTSERTKTS